jgi:hypothetical protein
MEFQRFKLTEILGSKAAKQFSGRNASVLKVQDLDEATSGLVRMAYAESLRKIRVLFTCTAACALIASLFLTKTTLSKVPERVRVGLEKVEAGLPEP